MSKARDLANLGSNTSSLATDSEVTAAVSPKANTTDVNTALSAKADSSSTIANSTLTAKGDLIAATAASTVARVGVGTDGQVLTANSGAAAGVAWTSPSTGSLTLLSTTTLSGSQTSITGISQSYKNLLIIARGMLINAAGNAINVQLNTVAGSYVNGSGSGQTAAWTSGNNIPSSSTYAPWNHFALTLYGYASGNPVPYFISYCVNYGSGGTASAWGGSYYGSPAAISSVQLNALAGTTFTGGTVQIYGVN